MMVGPTHNEADLNQKRALWMGGGAQKDSPGQGYKAVLWGCHDGTDGVAATRTAATQSQILDLDPESVGSGSGGPGRTYTPPYGLGGGCGGASLAGSGRHPEW